MAILKKEEGKIKPKPFLDTNILLDYIRKRNRESEIFFDTIKNKKILCWTSYVVILELINTTHEKEWIEIRYKKYHETFDEIYRKRNSKHLTSTDLDHANKQLKKDFLEPFIDAEIIHMVDAATNDWDNIIDLVSNKNCSIMDAIHVDSALGAKCNVFVTNDRQLKKVIEENKLILVSSLENLNDTLKKNGIRPIISFETHPR